MGVHDFSICHLDGGQTTKFARAVINPIDIGPNELLSSEFPENKCEI